MQEIDMERGILPIAIACIIGLFCYACGQKRFEIIDKKCSSCHKPDIVYSTKRPIQEWKRVMHGMKVRGMDISPHQEKKIMDILKEHYTP